MSEHWPRLFTHWDWPTIIAVFIVGCIPAAVYLWKTRNDYDD